MTDNENEQKSDETDNKYIFVQESHIHNKGVFAKIDIPKGTEIIEYIGEKVSKEEGSKRLDQSYQRHQADPDYHAATYIFELNDEYDLDGDVPNNPAKYINHSCDPNCEIEIVGDHIWIFATRDIKKDSELHYNYGHDLNKEDLYDFKKHPCYCGSPKCVGYIIDEDEWPKMKELLEKEKSQSIKIRPDFD